MDVHTLGNGIQTRNSKNGVVYSSDLGQISLISPCHFTMDMFEIYCLKGDLFDDIERYSTYDEVEERIFQVLLPPYILIE
jgi:hypothetical protein